jgi:hypothetical protein
MINDRRLAQRRQRKSVIRVDPGEWAGLQDSRHEALVIEN